MIARYIKLASILREVVEVAEPVARDRVELLFIAASTTEVDGAWLPRAELQATLTKILDGRDSVLAKIEAETSATKKET